jgi:hypothetical protein
MFLPPIFTNPLNWLKAGAAVITVAAAGWFWIHYNHLKEEAAEVPGLQREIHDLGLLHAHDDSEAAKAALQIVANDAARRQSELDFEKWNDLRNSIHDELKRLTSHAAATTNPVCAPTDDERRMWNAALDRLIAEPGH